jgi:hypothetical protein
MKNQISPAYAQALANARGVSLPAIGAALVAATSATNTAVAVPEMTDEQIVKVWQDMPGGPDGWLKQFGYLQFARALLATAPVPCAVDLLEEIAQSWDGCEYPDAMIKDIGAALRHDFARFAAPSAPVGAVLAAPSINSEELRKLVFSHASELYGGTTDEQIGAFKALIAHIDQHVASQVRAARDAAIPAGWKLVPIEPTPEMLAATLQGAVVAPALRAIADVGLKKNWQAMLAAAPAISHSGEGND